MGKLKKMSSDQFTVEVWLSSRHWNKGKIEEKTKDEEIRSLTLNDDDFFIQDEKGKTNINFGFGKVVLSKKLFRKGLKDYRKDNNPIYRFLNYVRYRFS